MNLNLVEVDSSNDHTSSSTASSRRPADLGSGRRKTPPELLRACAYVRRGVLYSHHDEVAARSHKRPQLPTRQARRVRGGEPGRPHSQPHREEAEAPPQLDATRLGAELHAHAPEGHHPHHRESQHRPEDTLML